MSAREALAAIADRDDKQRRDRAALGMDETQAEKDRGRLVATVAAMLAEHPRGDVIQTGGYDGTVPTEDDRIDDACQACEVPWPCPTVVAAEAQLTGPTPTRTTDTQQEHR